MWHVMSDMPRKKRMVGLAFDAELLDLLDEWNKIAYEYQQPEEVINHLRLKAE